jgi:hypothetical protein
MLPKLGLFDVTRFEQLKATGDLPSPKGAAMAIIKLTQKETTSIAELAGGYEPIRRLSVA